MWKGATMAPDDRTASSRSTPTSRTRSWPAYISRKCSMKRTAACRAMRRIAFRGSSPDSTMAAPISAFCSRSQATSDHSFVERRSACRSRIARSQDQREGPSGCEGATWLLGARSHLPPGAADAAAMAVIWACVMHVPS